MQASLFASMTCALLCTACAGIGARTVTADRFDYTSALSDSWKSQMLINVVKVRYGDAPVFLDVSSVIEAYELTQIGERRVHLAIYACHRVGSNCRGGGSLRQSPDDHL